VLRAVRNSPSRIQVLEYFAVSSASQFKSLVWFRRHLLHAFFQTDAHPWPRQYGCVVASGSITVSRNVIVEVGDCHGGSCNGGADGSSGGGGGGRGDGSGGGMSMMIILFFVNLFSVLI